ncbi:hypothetical protein [Actinomadura bangladeshensis]|uniref:Uncharacterized protein n=1 Tax=Actinomadura bangladeshensis TaxID=453573 RepID=A0A4R4P519_9ACTN|nr:hypothetical protein [Actinomadura bangladeshensis]TDC17501.1 hypothetical protein E1284_09065 [Actinomadura bangladeshensis]
MLSVAALLEARAGDDRPGLRSADDGRAWTWREVVAECAVRAAWMADRRGAERPVHVGVLLDNLPEPVFLLGAPLPDTSAIGPAALLMLIFLKRRLAKDGRRTEDPVWWRPGRDLAYRRMTAEDAARLRAELERCGRLHLLEGSG